MPPIHTTRFLDTASGLLMVGLLAAASYLIAGISWISKTGISSLVIAIVLGIMIGNAWHHPTAWTKGIQFAAKRLLRLAIILYGFRLSFQQIYSVGWQALILDSFIVASTLLLGYVVGRKLLKLDKDLSLLVSAGSAICGAAAVLAVEDILKSEPYKAAIAVGTVVLFGTATMFLYPVLQHAGIFSFNDMQYGIFTGASIHEVAQAVVAGSNVSEEAGKLAVIVKMMRVLLLVPVLFILAAFFKKKSQQKTKEHAQRIIVPWFAVGFVCIIGFNSLNVIPYSSLNSINQIDTFLLTMAMGAIGIETKWIKMKHVGMRPLYLAFFMFCWLTSSAYLIVKYTSS